MASQSMVRKLDTVFSKFIRLRDSSGGYFVCCSCRQTKPIEQSDAGHFINRRWMATRWREDNVHAQCRLCNRFNEGDGPAYSMFMIERYGKAHVEYLIALKNEYAGFSDYDLELMIKDYKAKIKSLS